MLLVALRLLLDDDLVDLIHVVEIAIEGAAVDTCSLCHLTYGDLTDGLGLIQIPKAVADLLTGHIGDFRLLCHSAFPLST